MNINDAVPIIGTGTYLELVWTVLSLLGVVAALLITQPRILNYRSLHRDPMAEPSAYLIAQALLSRAILKDLEFSIMTTLGTIAFFTIPGTASSITIPMLILVVILLVIESLADVLFLERITAQTRKEVRATLVPNAFVGL